MRAHMILAAFALATIAPSIAYADGMDPAPAAESAPAQAPATTPVPLWPTQTATGAETPTPAQVAMTEEAPARASAKGADVATGAYEASLVVIRTGPARTSSFAFGAAGASTGRR